MQKVELSDEQTHFLAVAMQGKNILVDACIGSGKTTSIQRLCEVLPPEKRILYLTYNRLLKLDARTKIHRRNVTVTNYHGFAYMALSRHGISAGIHDLIQTFNRIKPSIPHYDVLVLDEYQDIEQELAELLEYIKSANRSMQIIAVGDMEQKIYDKTALDVKQFIDGFLGDCERLTFTKCFRLSEAHAAMLGRIWRKKIVGVNPSCRILGMGMEDAIAFLSIQQPRDILCLGARTGDMAEVLNTLEDRFPEKFNKSTVYASIQDEDGGRAVDPTNRCAIFTTYDSSKGLERKICMVFDFTESYWAVRIEKPQQSYHILRNIFCVAASRGKEKIIFVSSGEEKLSEQSLATVPPLDVFFTNMDMSSMFDFKYIEDVEACYALLHISPVPQGDHREIKIKNRDKLIDLSPCIGIFQEAVFFKDYDIDKEIKMFLDIHPNLSFLFSAAIRLAPIEKKILFLTSLVTKQDRYRKQVLTPFIRTTEKRRLIRRLATALSPDEDVQVPCSVAFGDGAGGKAFLANGLADAVKDDVVYELKYVSELSHPHFLQCAMYMIGLGLSKGVLWNTRNNDMHEIRIPDQIAFLDAVANAVTKRQLQKYYPVEE